MAQSSAPVSKKTPKNLSKGANWHGEFTTDTQGNKHFNCPCEGQPQQVSKKLASRLASVPKDEKGMHFIKPGSQNRKK